MLTSLWPRFNPQIFFLVTVLTPGEEGGGYFTGFSSLLSYNHKSKTLNSNLEYFCLFSFPPPPFYPVVLHPPLPPLHHVECTFSSVSSPVFFPDGDLWSCSCSSKPEESEIQRSVSSNFRWVWWRASKSTTLQNYSTHSPSFATLEREIRISSLQGFILTLYTFFQFYNCSWAHHAQPLGLLQCALWIRWLWHNPCLSQLATWILKTWSLMSIAALLHWLSPPFLRWVKLLGEISFLFSFKICMSLYMKVTAFWYWLLLICF